MLMPIIVMFLSIIFIESLKALMKIFSVVGAISLVVILMIIFT